MNNFESLEQIDVAVHIKNETDVKLKLNSVEIGKRKIPMSCRALTLFGLGDLMCISNEFYTQFDCIHLHTHTHAV